MELEQEAREASEDVGVPTEDTIQRPETDAELASAAESSPEITAEPTSPEVAADPEIAREAAPPEEKEEAELTNLLSPDASPEGHEGLTAAEPDTPNLDVRLNQEDPEPEAAPGGTVEEIVAEEEPTPAAEGEPGSDDSPETVEPTERTGDESLESIVEDLKRRGQQ